MHQHPGLFADLTVSENIFIGHMPRGPFGVDYDRMSERTRSLLAIVGLSCRPEDTLKGLRPSEQQLVEIARALSVDAKALIMDEPTAALSQREVERLFAVVAELKARADRHSPPPASPGLLPRCGQAAAGANCCSRYKCRNR